MEFLLELLLELFGEVLLQVVFEAVAEVLGALFRRSSTRSQPLPTRVPALVPALVRALAYAVLGAAAGVASLWVVPHSLMHTPAGRMAALLLAPIACGLAMVLAGRWRTRRGQARREIHRFANGYGFALGMAAVRYMLAR